MRRHVRERDCIGGLHRCTGSAGAQGMCRPDVCAHMPLCWCVHALNCVPECFWTSVRLSVRLFVSPCLSVSLLHLRVSFCVVVRLGASLSVSRGLSGPRCFSTRLWTSVRLCIVSGPVCVSQCVSGPLRIQVYLWAFVCLCVPLDLGASGCVYVSLRVSSNLSSSPRVCVSLCLGVLLSASLDLSVSLCIGVSLCTSECISGYLCVSVRHQTSVRLSVSLCLCASL